MDPQAAHHYLRHFFSFILFFYCGFVILFAIPLLQIARRTGLHFTLGLLPLLGPLGVMIAAYIIAFSPWKTLTA